MPLWTGGNGGSLPLKEPAVMSHATMIDIPKRQHLTRNGLDQRRLNK